MLPSYKKFPCLPLLIGVVVVQLNLTRASTQRIDLRPDASNDYQPQDLGHSTAHPKTRMNHSLTNSSTFTTTPTKTPTTFARTTLSKRTLSSTVAPTNSTTTTSKRPGLITRTSDAIYKALTGYFSHDDDEEDSEAKDGFGAKLTTVRLAPVESPPQTTPSPIGDRSELPATRGLKSGTIDPHPTRAAHDLFRSSLGNGSSVTLGTAAETRATTLTPSHSRQSRQSTVKPTLEQSYSNRISPTMSSTTKTSVRPKLTTPPHIQLEFSDHNYETSPPIERKTSSTTTHKPTSKTSPSSLAPHHEAFTLHDQLKKAESTTTTESPTTTRAATKPQKAATAAPKPILLSSTSKPAHDDRLRGNQLEGTRDNSTITSISSSFHLFSLLNQAITSISSELTFLNRTNRLARHQLPSHNDEPATSEGEQEIDIPRSIGSPVEENAQLGPIESKPNERLTNSRRTADGSVQTSADGASQNKQQVTSREDIMLLCRLLHKHLGHTPNNASVALNLRNLAENLGQLTEGANKTDGGESTTTLAPLKASGADLEVSNDDSKWTVNEPQLDLSDQSHGDRLLESVFSLAPQTGGASSLNKLDLGQSETSYEEAGSRLLTELFNLGFRKKLAAASSASPTGTGQDETESGAELAKNITLRVWSRTTTEGRGGRLRLVYWLLERLGARGHSAPSGPSRRRFKVLELAEAHDLLDQLDHSLVQQAINEIGLVRPRGVLVGAYKREADSNDQLQPPRVIDDQLGQSESDNKPSPSTLQLLVDRLSNSSFGQNFHLYLILFVVVLFCIILCIAVPVMCCKCMMPSRSLSGSSTESTSAGSKGTRKNRRLRQQLTSQTDDNGRRRPASRGFYKSTDPLRESITSISGALAANRGTDQDGSKQVETPAIWRKLSNSTTTMTRDEIRTLEDDGRFEIVCGAENGGQARNRAKMASDRSKFEWYTFEDNKEQTTRRRLTGPGASETEDGTRQQPRGRLIDKPTQTTMVVRDQCKVTKSVQTFARENEPQEASLDELSLSYRDRLETRDSNSLTKSELVMLKEKLIPIGQRVSQNNDIQTEQQNSRRRLVDHDYVNTAANQQQQTTKLPSRHIDSSSIESKNGLPTSDRPIRATGESSSGAGGVQTRTQPPVGVSERAPSMRYLELPVQTQTKVDAIKNELIKLEARDADMKGTYKRYDVV